MKNKALIGCGGIVILTVAIGVFIFSMGVSAQNKAINLEEQINSAKSSIEVQEKRRVDLIYNLVDTVEAYAKHERDTLAQIVEARSQAKGGNIEEAALTIQAVVEAYPELKANENYKTLMLELTTTENLIAEHRNAYNTQVRAYNKHVRTFPNGMLLGLSGYQQLDAEYLEFNAPSDAPQNLFDDKE